MKLYNFDDVIQRLSFEEAIGVMKQCFVDYYNGIISQSDRTIELLPDGKNQNIFAMMPAYLGPDRFFGAKMITAFPSNPSLNIPSHLGEILLFDSSNGAPVAMVNANAVTWIRTAAVSALATDYLAKKGASRLALFGTGQQATSHLKAISCIRPISTVFVYDINVSRRKTFIDTAQEEFPEIQFINCNSVEETAKSSEIICTLTSSKEAFLDKKIIAPGTHINAIGTFTPITRELTTNLMVQGKIFVDDYNAALKESGDLLIPISEGVLGSESIIGSLGEIIVNSNTTLNNHNDITIFDAVGLAIEDLCCAEYIIQK